MKSLLNLVAVVAALGSMATAQADEPKARSTELQALDRYAGSWEETSLAKPALWTPERSTATTTTTRRWILNGQMIENKGAWLPGKNEFLHLMTYDSNRKEYRQWYFDKDNLVPRHTKGNGMQRLRHSHFSELSATASNQPASSISWTTIRLRGRWLLRTEQERWFLTWKASACGRNSHIE